MNETQKTGIFAAIAALAVLLAFVTRPVSITKEDEKGGLAAGDLLFKDEASDVTKATSLKITKFDENKLSMESFEVVRDKDTGLWKIPSEYSYPADAEEQLKNATSPLAGMKILNVMKEAAVAVITRSTAWLSPATSWKRVTGVGMMVNVADSTGKSMASLIIGKKIEGPKRTCTTSAFLIKTRSTPSKSILPFSIPISRSGSSQTFLTVKGFESRNRYSRLSHAATTNCTGCERRYGTNNGSRFSYDANTNNESRSPGGVSMAR